MNNHSFSFFTCATGVIVKDDVLGFVRNGNVILHILLESFSVELFSTLVIDKDDSYMIFLDSFLPEGPRSTFRLNFLAEFETS